MMVDFLPGINIPCVQCVNISCVSVDIFHHLLFTEKESWTLLSVLTLLKKFSFSWTCRPRRSVSFCRTCLPCSFPIWSCTHTLMVSPLFVSPPWTGVFSLWLTSRSRRLWRSTWWRRSNANKTARDATVFFCLLSLSLPHLCYLFSVSLRLSLHACFSAALWFICGKTKKEKMLSFYLFLFFFCQILFSCVSSSAMKPFSPSVSLHPSFSSSLPRYEYNYSITMVNDNLTVWGSL